MQYLATLDGEELGVVTIGEPRPSSGSNIMLRYKGEPVQALVVKEVFELEIGRLTLHCMRPETYRVLGAAGIEPEK